jgi:methionyl-tRNA formyltransferase
MTIGANLVVKTVDSIAEGNIKTIPQETIANQILNAAPKISKEYCRLDFDDSVKQIHNKIRGLSPYPAAWASIPDSDDTFKIFESSFVVESHNLNPGTFICDNKSYLKIAANDGFVFIHDLQIAGKKRMKVRDLLNGYKF